MTSEEAFAKIVIQVAPFISYGNLQRFGNPMPKVREILEELERDTEKKTIDKVVK